MIYSFEVLAVIKNRKIKLSMVVHVCNLRTRDPAEERGSRVQVQPGLNSKSEASMSSITRAGLKLQCLYMYTCIILRSWLHKNRSWGIFVSWAVLCQPMNEVLVILSKSSEPIFPNEHSCSYSCKFGTERKISTTVINPKYLSIMFPNYFRWFL